MVTYCRQVPLRLHMWWLEPHGRFHEQAWGVAMATLNVKSAALVLMAISSIESHSPSFQGLLLVSPLLFGRALAALGGIDTHVLDVHSCWFALRKEIRTHVCAGGFLWSRRLCYS